MRFAIIYPAAGLLLKLLLFFMPSLSSKRVTHLSFTEDKIQKRLDRKTDRKDFMTYASFSLPILLRLG